MSSNQPSWAPPTVIRVALVTTSGTTPPPNGPELTWMVLASTFDTQPTASPSGRSRPGVNPSSPGSGGQSISTTAARSARLPAAAPMERKRLLPDTTRLLVEKPLDRVED